MSRFVIIAGLALAVIAAAGSGAGAAGPELAQQPDDAALCMKACLDQNPGEKAACAIQCGLVERGVTQPRRDCGVDYKACMQTCGKDKDCRAACRDARRRCI